MLIMYLLWKEPVTPIKIAYKQSDECTIKQDNVYDNKQSKIKYDIQPPIAKQEAVYTRLPWDTVKYILYLH